MSVEEVSIFKPSSKVYDMPIKKYNIKEKEVAFLSSNTWDVSGVAIMVLTQFGSIETMQLSII